MIKKSNRKKVLHCNLNEIYMSLAFNKGAVLVLHAPKSCSHIVYNAFLESQRRSLFRQLPVSLVGPDNLFITGMTNDDTIFGGEDLLKTVLTAVIKEKAPEYVVVAAGCAAGVIGDDVDGVCKEVEEIFQVPVIPIPGAGFMSNQQEEGFLLATKCLYHKFKRRKNVRDNKSVVIFGMRQSGLLAADKAEIRRMFAYFGISRVMLPPCQMTVQDIQNLGEAGLAGVYSINAQKLTAYRQYAAEFADELHIPLVGKRLPLTIRETVVYLQELGKVLGKEQKAAEVVRREQERWQAAAEGMAQCLQGKTCTLAISISPRFLQLDELLALLTAIGLQVCQIILLDELTEKECQGYESFMSYHQTAIKSSRENDIVPATDIVVTTAYREIFPCQCCIKRSRIGIGGAIGLGEKIKLLVTEGRRLVNE